MHALVCTCSVLYVHSSLLKLAFNHQECPTESVARPFARLRWALLLVNLCVRLRSVGRSFSFLDVGVREFIFVFLAVISV